MALSNSLFDSVLRRRLGEESSSERVRALPWSLLPLK